MRALRFVVGIDGSDTAEKKAGEIKFGEHKCVMCHGVKAANLAPKTKSARMKGPDLSGFKTKLEMSELSSFVRGETPIDGSRHRKPFKGTDEELQAILDWLGSLEATN